MSKRLIWTITAFALAFLLLLSPTFELRIPWLDDANGEAVELSVGHTDTAEAATVHERCRWSWGTIACTHTFSRYGTRKVARRAAAASALLATAGTYGKFFAPIAGWVSVAAQRAQDSGKCLRISSRRFSVHVIPTGAYSTRCPH